MADVTQMPVIANAKWNGATNSAQFHTPSGWTAYITKFGVLYAVSCMATDSQEYDNNTDFGSIQTDLTEFQANLAIRDIFDLDKFGKSRSADYDERPTR